MTPHHTSKISKLHVRLALIEEGLNAFPSELDAQDIADIEEMQVRAEQLEHELSELIKQGEKA